MTTANDLRRAVDDVLDYLQEAELALQVNSVAITPSRVTWHGFTVLDGFLDHRSDSAIDQYRRWLVSGNYSALLLDGSLLQITYDVEGAQVVAHRLAYIPCPITLDQQLLQEGYAVDDIVSMYEHASDVAARSHVRFDFDARSARPGHPAAHLTINSADCRIACTAPVHVGRFVDFVYRHFYPALWAAHQDFFDASAHRHVAGPTITDDDRASVHLAWAAH